MNTWSAWHRRLTRSALLTDKVVLVTGASRGLGRAIALEFARRGAKLALAARSEDALDRTRREVESFGVEAIAPRADVTSDDDVTALVNETLARFGRIDVVVNNAGIARVGAADVASFAGDVNAILGASFFGMVGVTQAVLPAFRRQGSGAIVNLSSVMGRKAFARFGAYAVAMHAVSAFSDSLRQEVRGTGIHVMTVYPALTESDLLRDVSPADMPPPFRHLTPLKAERVARDVVDGVARGRRRVVAPRRANMLLLGDALSARLGDGIARALAHGALARILRLSSGETYHQAIGAKSRRSDVSTPTLSRVSEARR
jgi:short-subunit dehydrogenase